MRSPHEGQPSRGGRVFRRSDRTPCVNCGSKSAQTPVMAMGLSRVRVSQPLQPHHGRPSDQPAPSAKQGHPAPTHKATGALAGTSGIRMFDGQPHTRGHHCQGGWGGLQGRRHAGQMGQNRAEAGQQELEEGCRLCGPPPPPTSDAVAAAGGAMRQISRRLRQRWRALGCVLVGVSPVTRVSTPCGDR